MASSTVRIREETRAILHQLARETREPMQDILAKALEVYRRQRIIDEANAAYAAMWADPRAAEEEQAERAAWDATLLDGLEDEYSREDE